MIRPNTLSLALLLLISPTQLAASPPPTPSSQKPSSPPGTNRKRTAKPTHGSIEVPVANLRNFGKGTLWVRLLTKTGRISGKEVPFRAGRMRVKSKAVRFVFASVPPGEYAIFVLHDMDGDGKLATTVIGIPDEDIAISRNAKGGPFGGPKWRKARFVHRTAKTVLAPLVMTHFHD
ncbi:MAG: DUF2141 domain-containing protein [Myxococcales bacterium]|nr:DUF2141 domain-containing protein [Myxococcales bacterium]